MKITVLGGAGTVGSISVRALASSGYVDKLRIADLNVQRAKEIAKELGGNVEVFKFNAEDITSIKEAIKGFDVVLNTVGPFYKYGPRILSTVIDSGINYVDICDDYDATVEMLKLDSKAKKKEVSALIGMGSSPGLGNIVIKFVVDFLLDEVESIDIYHAHGGEPREGPAVVRHRIHSMLIDIPVFLDGEFKTVRLFEESGRALEEEVDFCGIGKYRVYAYPHPETITLPRYIKGVKRVTNLGLVLPPEYAELIKTIVRIGMASEEPIEVNGIKIKPIDFAVAFILHQRPKILEKAGLTEPIGCLKIVIKGKADGKPTTYIIEALSRGGMMHGTGVPAAIGAIMMGKGMIKEKGVFPPEAAVDPIEFIKLGSEILKKAKFEGVEKELPLKIYRIDERGVKHEVPLPI